MADTAPGGWLNRRTLTWAGYDVASSVYFGVAPAVLLPVYFQQQLAGFANPTAAWGALAAGAILASSVAALIAAALSSRISRFTLLSVATAGLVLAISARAWPLLPSAAAYGTVCPQFIALTASLGLGSLPWLPPTLASFSCYPF